MKNNVVTADVIYLYDGKYKTQEAKVKLNPKDMDTLCPNTDIPNNAYVLVRPKDAEWSESIDDAIEQLKKGEQQLVKINRK